MVEKVQIGFFFAPALGIPITWSTFLKIRLPSSLGGVMYLRHRICFRGIGLWVIGLAFIVQGCKLPEVTLPTAGTSATNLPGPSRAGTSPTGTTAPQAVSPPVGSSVNETQPVLVINNATTVDGSTPTYFFQIATDLGFADVVASSEQVPEGPSLSLIHR